MSSPNDRKYLETHEWHLAKGNVVTIGISKFAIDELTDITFVQLPPAGTSVQAGGTLGEIESVKTSSEFYSGVAGKVVEVNAAVEADPGIVNRDPYGEGWLVKIQADSADLSDLLDAAAYDAKYPTS